MQKFLFGSLLVLLVLFSWSFILEDTKKGEIYTEDVTNFWRAYDLLSVAESRSDSIAILEEEFLDKASRPMRGFIKIRNLTAAEYQRKILKHPEFWRSIRPLTEAAIREPAKVAAVMTAYEQKVPKFKAPSVCFAIGCMRTGGTIYKGNIIIGTEISAADSTVVTHEVNDWLQSVLGKTNDIRGMIAHEIVHTQQYGFCDDGLACKVMGEGIADFVAETVWGYHINTAVHTYALTKECEIWRDFQVDLEADPIPLLDWLYGGGRKSDRPADLGYFIGYQAAKAYYAQAADSEVALLEMFNRGNYDRILKESGYAGNCADN